LVELALEQGLVRDMEREMEMMLEGLESYRRGLSEPPLIRKWSAALPARTDNDGDSSNGASITLRLNRKALCGGGLLGGGLLGLAACAGKAFGWR
jgi:hypothetical protein